MVDSKKNLPFYFTFFGHRIPAKFVSYAACVSTPVKYDMGLSLQTSMEIQGEKLHIIFWKHSLDYIRLDSFNSCNHVISKDRTRQQG